MSDPVVAKPEDVITDDVTDESELDLLFADADDDIARDEDDSDKGGQGKSGGSQSGSAGRAPRRSMREHHNVADPSAVRDIVWLDDTSPKTLSAEPRVTGDTKPVALATAAAVALPVVERALMDIVREPALEMLPSSVRQRSAHHYEMLEAAVTVADAAPAIPARRAKLVVKEETSAVREGAPLVTAAADVAMPAVMPAPRRAFVDYTKLDQATTDQVTAMKADVTAKLVAPVVMQEFEKRGYVVEGQPKPVLDVIAAVSAAIWQDTPPSVQVKAAKDWAKLREENVQQPRAPFVVMKLDDQVVRITSLPAVDAPVALQQAASKAEGQAVRFFAISDDAGKELSTIAMAKPATADAAAPYKILAQVAAADAVVTPAVAGTAAPATVTAQAVTPLADAIAPVAQNAATTFVERVNKGEVALPAPVATTSASALKEMPAVSNIEKKTEEVFAQYQVILPRQKIELSTTRSSEDFFSGLRVGTRVQSVIDSTKPQAVAVLSTKPAFVPHKPVSASLPVSAVRVEPRKPNQFSQLRVVSNNSFPIKISSTSKLVSVSI